MMMFIVGLPVAQIILFCFSIGKNPVGLKLAIINNELNNSMQPCIPGTGCDLSLLSCRYLQHLQRKTLQLLPYDSDEEGRNAVTKGWVWGAITFPSNYSKALMTRIDYGRDAPEWDITSAEMKVVMDMSSKSLNVERNEIIFHAFVYKVSHSERVTILKNKHLSINDKDYIIFI